MPLSTEEQGRDFVESDLNFAGEHLKKSATSNGRVTSGAAYALLSRAMLYAERWAKAKAAAEEVINSGLYNLKTPYEDIFREKGENCSESVFELQCTATESQPGSNDIGSQFASVQGVRGAGEWNLGWGQHPATQELADA